MNHGSFFGYYIYRLKGSDLFHSLFMHGAQGLLHEGAWPGSIAASLEDIAYDSSWAFAGSGPQKVFLGNGRVWYRESLRGKLHHPTQIVSSAQGFGPFPFAVYAWCTGSAS